MNYEEVLHYMYEQLPMFHRIGPAAYKPGLDNTIALLDVVGNPHVGMKCVHVAGTNGKGSTSHMISSTLQQAGYKTGLYTSPHLKDFRERIRIDGLEIEKEVVVEFVETFHHRWENIQPSFFEITVALCFWHFNQNNVDIAVIETGLGGRLDSTNVITPEVSVITNIGYDHMNLLGDTIEKIATEKAGIIKHGIPVVLGDMRDEALRVMIRKADEENAEVFLSSILRDDEVPTSDLVGYYQLENRKTAFTALSVLKKKLWKISSENVREGFLNVVKNTGLMGRWQVLGTDPLIIADVAHNEDGIRYILKQIAETPHDRLHFVLGIVGDKDSSLILKTLPKNAIYYFCKADIPRGLDANELHEQGRAYGLNGVAYSSVMEAYNAAKRQASKDDMVFVGGSVFTVAEVL